VTTENTHTSSSYPLQNSIIEALIFASDEPLSPTQIVDIFGILIEGERTHRLTQEIVLRTVDELNAAYQSAKRPFRIVRVAGGYQFATLPEYGIWLGKMLRERSRRKLSVSALETLAVVAYKQPVTKPEIESIRGVNVDYVLRTLLERNMVAIIGRAATPGRPLLYGTTKQFLKHFGINELSDLPKPREIDELLAEAEFEVEKRLLKEMEEKTQESADDGLGSILVDEEGALEIPGIPDPESENRKTGDGKTE